MFKYLSPATSRLATQTSKRLTTFRAIPTQPSSSWRLDRIFLEDGVRYQSIGRKRSDQSLSFNHAFRLTEGAQRKELNRLKVKRDQVKASISEHTTRKGEIETEIDRIDGWRQNVDMLDALGRYGVALNMVPVDDGALKESIVCFCKTLRRSGC